MFSESAEKFRQLQEATAKLARRGEVVQANYNGQRIVAPGKNPTPRGKWKSTYSAFRSFGVRGDKAIKNSAAGFKRPPKED